ncbi:MAG: hypothetical protein WKF41_13250 [Gaiellaceae bacterium]
MRGSCRLLWTGIVAAHVVWAGIDALSQPLKHEVPRELATAVAIDSHWRRTAPRRAARR